MGFRDWVQTVFAGKKTMHLDKCHFDLVAESHFQSLALETAISLIANAVVRCDFQTYLKGKRFRGNQDYLLNIQPNKNQNASEFMHLMVRKYVEEGECLIIMQNDELIIVDDFETKTSILHENIYKEVRIDDFKFDKPFYEKDVLHLKMSDKKIIDLVNKVHSTQGKLIASAMSYYRRKNNKRLLLKGDFLRAQTTEMQKQIDDMFEGQLKNWFDPDKGGAAFQLQDGYQMEDMSDSAAGTSSSDSRDIKNLINDIFDTTAVAFHIPQALLRGDVADVSEVTKNFLTFCVNPIVEVISDEFNRKFYSREEYIERTFLKVDTSRIQATDLTTLSNAIDKLFRVGGITINDIQDMLGFEQLEDDFSDQRFVTKNYAAVEQLVSGSAPKGGDNDDNETIQE